MVALATIGSQFDQLSIDARIAALEAISAAQGIPGMIIEYAGTSVPTGWLACNGALISRTAYPALFAAIGTIWGVGDGVTTFGLPNLPDFTRGSNGGAVGATGGTTSTTLTTGQIPQMTGTVTDPGHTHTVTDPGHGHGVTDPGHTHASVVAASANTAGAAAGSVVAGNVTAATTGVSVNSNTTGATNNSATTGISIVVGAAVPGTVSIIPSFAVVQRLIKT